MAENEGKEKSEALTGLLQRSGGYGTRDRSPDFTYTLTVKLNEKATAQDVSAVEDAVYAATRQTPVHINDYPARANITGAGVITHLYRIDQRLDQRSIEDEIGTRFGDDRVHDVDLSALHHQ